VQEGWCVQVNDSSPNEAETKSTSPLTSPIKSSRSNSTHAASAPASVGVSGPDSHTLTQSDSDDGEKTKKKVQHTF